LGTLREGGGLTLLRGAFFCGLQKRVLGGGKEVLTGSPLKESIILERALKNKKKRRRSQEGYLLIIGRRKREGGEYRKGIFLSGELGLKPEYRS